MRGHEIAIAGCGPAGMAAALLLHRGGHRVTLFERFEQPQPLGSGLMLQPTGLAVLERLGLARLVVGQGARIAQLFGRCASGRIVLDARYRDLGIRDAFGLGIHRACLFTALYDAIVSEGIPVRSGCEVTGSYLQGSARFLTMRDAGDAGPFDLVVDALGLRTSLAPPTGRWLEFGALWTSVTLPGQPFAPDWLEQRYRGAREMVGVLPTGTPTGGAGPQAALFWSLRHDQLSAWRSEGLAKWKEQVLALWPDCAALLDQIADPEQLTFARYSHRTLRRPVGTRIIHIGDSWHSASPQLGQGANMALLDAWALAEGLRLMDDLQDGLALAAALRSAHVKLYQYVTALFTPLYQSEHWFPPLIRDRLLAPLSRVWPASAIQAALVGGLAGMPLGLLGLGPPDYAALAA
ncbi:MAG TPA: NAD(P)/FAD-dependent oxidoreductase [Novosphingobium sp.]|nr:NAD(P)/FAD-dependent oxidoreductase [Novosphingobium sp.]